MDCFYVVGQYYLIVGNFWTQWTLVLIFLMHFIIVFVQLFRCTRLTPFLYLLFKLLVNFKSFIADKTYKCPLLMNFPFVRVHTFYKMVVIITAGTLELILVSVFNVLPNNFHVWW